MSYFSGNAILNAIISSNKYISCYIYSISDLKFIKFFFLISFEFIKTSPLFIGSNPIKEFSNVDFPTPLLPVIKYFLFSLKVKDKFLIINESFLFIEIFLNSKVLIFHLLMSLIYSLFFILNFKNKSFEDLKF